MAYISKKLESAEAKRPHDEKEMMALLYCIKQWKYYFVGRSKAIVHSDNRRLVNLRTSKDPHHRIHRFLELFQEPVDSVVRVFAQ